MRRIYLTITMTVLLLAGGHCAFAKKSKTIEVETAKFEKSDSTAEVSVLVQWPVNGDKIIVDSLRHHINYLLGDELNRPEELYYYSRSPGADKVERFSKKNLEIWRKYPIFASRTTTHIV